MKKKLTVKNLLFYWLFSIVAVNETHSAVKIAFISPIHLLKEYRQPHSLNYFHHKTTNDMKVHIKKVLNMHLENSTLDKYISSIFNLNNVNPTYVFRLPDNKNRTLIFRKSDFTAAVFPNITNVNKFTKSTENLQTSSSIKHPVKVKNEELLDELKHEQFIFENNLSYNNDDYDDNMKKIVDENVRSEKDFIQLMTELNEDLNEEDLREKYHQKLTKPAVKVANKKPKYVEPNAQKKSEEEEWEELGLSGWSGTMSVSKEDLPKKEKSKQSKKMLTALIPIYHNFDPLAFLKFPSSSTSLQKPNYYRPPQTSQESEIEMEEISDQLSAILLKDEQVLLNKTGKLPNQKPRWPITTTRDQHGDNDVFLARANNPFGHSTKWKYNNSTDIREPHREGRSKRGVFHLYSMIKCATGCDPLVYKGYGCYCGFLGSGKALDGIDRCCKAHDYCYSAANCIFYTEYFVPYLWKCYRGKPLCAIDNGEWGGPGSCATRLCQCDLALSRCLRHHYCPKKRPVCVSSPFRLLQNLVMVF